MMGDKSRFALLYLLSERKIVNWCKLVTWCTLYRFINSEITSLRAFGSFSFHFDRLGTFSSKNCSSTFMRKLSSSNLKSGANQGAVPSNIISHFSFFEQYGKTIRIWQSPPSEFPETLSKSTFVLHRPANAIYLLKFIGYLKTTWTYMHQTTNDLPSFKSWYTFWM